jgi:pullulanase
MLAADLLNRRKTHFTLWRPNANTDAPKLVIGTFLAGNPNVVTNRVELPLVTSENTPGLWTLDARDTGLADGIYHYWYRVDNTRPGRPTGSAVLVTDPFATTVDWRVLSETPSGFNAFDDPQPASVIRLVNGTLSAVDPGGETSTFSNDPAPDTLPANNRLVIYELPTAWTRVGDTGGRERAVGTFKDVLGLVDENAEGANFAGLVVLQKGHSYLTELGVNGLELLPAADSFFKRASGYDTAHYLAPDWELGFPDGQEASTSNSDLADVVESCHRHGIRFFIDVVMAFAKNEANQWIDFDDFYLLDAHQTPNDPDAHTSGRADGHQDIRDGFGSTLFRYARPLPNPAYDPIGGGTVQDAPARATLYSYLTRWMRDFRVDGIRMDSVENVANWDFIQGYKDRARTLFRERWQAAGLGAGADEHFLVVGEELTLPFALLTQQRLDGLWNEEFLRRLRPAIQGSSKNGESFEQTIRRLIDCRNLGFSDGAQAIIYCKAIFHCPRQCSACRASSICQSVKRIDTWKKHPS